MDSLLEARGYKPTYLTTHVEKRLPKLHLKSQFFASKEALSTLIPRAGWKQLIHDYILARASQRSRKGEEYVDPKELRTALSDATLPLVNGWLEVDP
jgi:hypothetical protein